MSIDTSFDLQPTDTDPHGDEQTIDAPPATTTPAPAPTPKVDHTDGGLPAIPLLVITSNTAAASLSAAAVVGGPLAAAGLAAAGAVSAVTVAATTRRKAQKAVRRAPVKPAPKKAPNRQHTPTRTLSAGATRTNGTKQAAGTRSGSGTRPQAGGRGTSGGARNTTNRSAGKTLAAKTTSGNTSTKTPASLKKSTTGKTLAPKATGRTTPAPKGRIKEIKALRKEKKADGKTRKAQREQATQTRRALKDGRRGEKQALKKLKKQNLASPKTPTTGLAGTPAVKTNKPGGPGKHSKAGKAGIGAALKKAVSKKTDRVRNKVRGHQDNQNLNRAQRIRQGRRNAQARATLTRKVAASKARYAVKAAGAALLSAPVALLGCLTTPLGRKLGWAWLMHPGRRMYRRLTANAKHNHLARVADAKNTHAHTTNPASSDTAPNLDYLANDVPRGPRQNSHLATLGEPVMTAELQFHFDESAADMEAAAAAYEPGGMIHVYQTIQGMPAGIQSWANTFKILAEKSDESFPLEAEVGEGLSEVFDLLQKAAQAAEEVQKTFETKHEHDLERLQSPRKSLEAEKGWDISANEDLL